MYNLDNLMDEISINQGNIVRERGNLCYIYNTSKKAHLFISKEVLEYVKQAAHIKLSLKDFINKFQCEDDKYYMIEAMHRLMQLGYLNIGKSKEENQNKNFDCVYITLTNRCNLNCIHCALNSSPVEKDILSTEDIFIILKDISKLNPKTIIFTGGEPLLRKDLELILRQAVKLMPNTIFSLSTNATLISEDNIHLFKYFNKVDISIDGVNEETCAKVRGKGVFSKVINNIKYLQDNGICNISLSMVSGEKRNYLVNDFEKLNESLKTSPIIRGFTATGRGKENYTYFNYDRHTLPISMTDMLKKEGNSRKISSCSCTAFVSTLYIDYKGIAYPCYELLDDSYAITDLSKNEITCEEFYSRLEYKKSKFNRVLSFKDTKCENCDINIFCWFCPAVFENAKNNNEIDIWCKRIKNNLERIVWRQI